MGFISKTYEKNFLYRYDKDEAIPYSAPSDFPDLISEENSFKNSDDVTIKFFTYSYPDFKEDKLILFCPGMGPGHTPYFSEIENLCKAGYRVLTLDYTGCGASGGERLSSVNAPTRDIIELLDLLGPKEEVVPVGHSLGGYTALNIVHLSEKITKAVIISGFVGISDEMMGFVKFRPLADMVKRYEKKLDPRYGSVDNLKYLSDTKDRILWIHSTDDPVVNYRWNAGAVLKVNNPNVKVITVKNKKHNPHYTAEALEKMNLWMGEFYRLKKEKKFATLEEQKAFFNDKPVGKMTAQDPEIFKEIVKLIES